VGRSRERQLKVRVLGAFDGGVTGLRAEPSNSKKLIGKPAQPASTPLVTTAPTTHRTCPFGSRASRGIEGAHQVSAGVGREIGTGRPGARLDVVEGGVPGSAGTKDLVIGHQNGRTDFNGDRRIQHQIGCGGNRARPWDDCRLRRRGSSDWEGGSSFLQSCCHLCCRRWTRFL